MNFQIVARFLATTAHNHGAAQRASLLSIQKTKNSLRTLKSPQNAKFLPCKQYLAFLVKD
jgi:transcriptional regulator